MIHGMSALATMIALQIPILGGWTVIKAEKPEKWASLEGIAYLLSGVEGTLLVGSATVTSSKPGENNVPEIVARGEAFNSGGSVSLYGGPTSTGWRLSPTAGWMDQNVAIGDLSQDIPTNTPSEGYDIPGSCEDPSNGSSIPCDIPNTYDLRLRSISAGIAGGYDIIIGGPRFHIMGGLGADLNLLEYRLIDVLLADNQRSHTQISPVRAAGVQSTLGFVLPKWHLAFRGTLSLRRHGQFSFGEPITVQGPATYDEEREVYYRPLIAIDRAGYTSRTAQMSAAILF